MQRSLSISVVEGVADSVFGLVCRSVFVCIVRISNLHVCVGRHSSRTGVVDHCRSLGPSTLHVGKLHVIGRSHVRHITLSQNNNDNDGLGNGTPYSLAM